MQSQTITVHDVQAAIDDVGVRPYANTVVRDMAGRYFFVEADFLDESPVSEPGYAVEAFEDRNTMICDPTPPDGSEVPMRYKKYWIRYKIHEIPTKLAFFITNFLNLKAQFERLGVEGGPMEKDSRTSVYLTPGKELFGHKIKVLTEIPAELRPVVVERM